MFCCFFYTTSLVKTNERVKLKFKILLYFTSLPKILLCKTSEKKRKLTLPYKICNQSSHRSPINPIYLGPAKFYQMYVGFTTIQPNLRGIHQYSTKCTWGSTSIQSNLCGTYQNLTQFIWNPPKFQPNIYGNYQILTQSSWDPPNSY